MVITSEEPQRNQWEKQKSDITEEILLPSKAAITQPDTPDHTSILFPKMHAQFFPSFTSDTKINELS